MKMKQSWRVPDFLDLEYFFAGDKQQADEQGETVLRNRDRELYLDTIGGEDGDTSPDRDWLIFRWLQERRSLENTEQGGQALLPGRMWYELYGLFWSLFSFLAFAAGGGLCYSYLSYTGEQPVNVSLFFLVFVGFQLLLLFALPVAWSIRKLRGLDLRSSLVLSLVNRGLNRFLFTIRKTGFAHRSSECKQHFAASLAMVQTRGSGYGTLFFWPLFLLFQLFGIAFNFGALGALLVKVASSDLAFGWQSTIQLSSEVVARCVQWLALPWSWFLGETSYPGLAQIEGSRMVLKDGFYHLASVDLVSWWPFLCLAICFYCLLPRMVLFVFGSMARKRVLAAVSFNRAEHNQLVHRLLTPRLNTQVQKGKDKEKAFEKIPEEVQAEVQENPLPIVERKPQKKVAEAEEKPAVHGGLLALVPDEIFDDISTNILETHCEQRFGYTIAETLRIHEQYAENSTIFTALAKDSAQISSPLLVLQEAWQPPIQEMLSFLQELREQCQPELHIIVALIGKPTPDTLFTSVTESDRHIWQQKIATLKDPFLQLSTLVEES